jgi:CBS domain containing-hemolysin-like protein
MMLFLLGLMLCLGLFLSAFFSGSETGFYRATRTRLALHALEGDLVSRGLIWLTNNPTMFVATTLVGNNIANYLASWSIVLGTAQLAGSTSKGIDLAVSILLSPVIFIYGELLPKNLFYHAPNRLLRLCGPLFLFCSVLFAPLAAILWLLGRLLERLLGESPERLQLRLVRSELRRVISEGHEAGVLQPTQRQMADGMFHVATLPLDRFCVPTSRLAVVRDSMSPKEMLRIARRRRSSVVFVQDNKRRLMGYLYVVDLHLESDAPPQPKPLMRIRRRESSIAALTAMQEADETLAIVMAEHGNILGIVQVATLAQSIFSPS